MPTTTAIGRLGHVTAVINDWLNADGVEPVLEAAAEAAHQLASTPVAAVVFSPGNGYTYQIAVTRLADEAVNSWGGSHIIALPEFHACALLNLGYAGYHVPGYIAEKMRLGAPHEGVVAAFATLLDAITSP